MFSSVTFPSEQNIVSSIGFLDKHLQPALLFGTSLLLVRLHYSRHVLFTGHIGCNEAHSFTSCSISMD